MNYYEKHDIIPQQVGFNIFTEVIDVNRMVSFSSIAQAAEIDVNELRILNPSYKKQVVNGTPASPKQLVIPAISKQLYASLYDVLNSEVHEQPQIIAAINRSSDLSPITIPETHRVKEGQTLDMVANQYGLEVQDLKVYNNLKNMEVVPGQLVRLRHERTNTKPKEVVPSYVTYVVKVGDTLSEIASKFSGTTVPRIKALNGLKKNTVQPGMRLKINRG